MRGGILEPRGAVQMQPPGMPGKVHRDPAGQPHDAVEEQVAAMPRERRRRRRGEVGEAPEIELIVVLREPEGGVVVEVLQAGEGEFAVVAAERPSRRHGKLAEIVEREPASHVLSEFGGHGIGDVRQLVEIEMSPVPREFPGNRDRKPEHLVQIEMGGVVADGVGRAVGGRSGERERSASGGGDRIVGVIRERLLGGLDGPTEQGHEFPGAFRVEVTDGAGVFPQGLLLAEGVVSSSGSCFRQGRSPPTVAAVGRPCRCRSA